MRVRLKRIELYFFHPDMGGLQISNFRVGRYQGKGLSNYILQIIIFKKNPVSFYEEYLRQGGG